MSPSLESYLRQAYPLLFNQDSEISVRDGWFHLVSRLCTILTLHIKEEIPEDLRSQVYVQQCKQKFGGLRFYLTHTDDYMRGAITMAEYQGSNTCELCGNTGVMKNIGGFVQTLCSKDFDERK